jgi:PAS domain S-box-containing protein
MKTDSVLAEQKRTEQALRESEQRYKRLLAAITDYIYSVDLRNGHAGVASHGPGCESVTGYTQQEFREDPYLWYRLIYEGDRPAVIAQVNRILQDEPLVPLEHRIIRKDGQVRWVRNTTISHRNEQGQLIGYEGLISDVTHRKLAEIALQESKERLALVIQGSNDGIWDWNLITSEIYFSPRWKSMLGYDDTELKNQRVSWEMLLHPEEREQVLAKLKACLASQSSTFETELRLRHKDGTYRWILVRAVVLRDPQGQALRMAGSHVDVTERKLAAEQLQQANAKLARKSEILRKLVRRLNASRRELKSTQERLIQTAKLELAGTLAAGVAHEVKNPLQTIIMGIHLLSQKLPPQQRTAEVSLALEEMGAAVFRAKSIISDLLILARPMKFKQQLHDINSLIESSIRLLRGELVKSKISVERQFDAGLPFASLDPQRIEQVFLNLLLNAVQAMPKGGTITIRTANHRISEFGLPRAGFPGKFCSGERVALITIQDCGTGVPEDLLPRVFDPFFTTKPPGVGTGLGLSMAKKIVELHGGLIDLKNTSSGGAVATVILKLNGGPENE